MYLFQKCCARQTNAVYWPDALGIGYVVDLNVGFADHVKRYFLSVRCLLLSEFVWLTWMLIDGIELGLTYMLTVRNRGDKGYL